MPRGESDHFSIFADGIIIQHVGAVREPPDGVYFHGNSKKMTDAIGEVVNTSTTEIVGQCRRNGRPPAFGSFIQVGVEICRIGVVYNVETTSIDPNRRPSALGLSEEQLQRSYPQLSSLLRSQFQALLIGWLSDNRFVYGLPQTPPSLHAQVQPCRDEVIRCISRDLGFLRLIYASGKSATEDLLLGVCRSIIEAHERKRTEAVRVGKAVSELYRDDYDTLKRFITRLESWL
ncbi:MAG: hypothetical protein C4527_10200 [Candidatus Omnitrophota bacterium]|jgi:hypothetical protein|nr:MAG: hypothetical protein C4527_10200 [Candidatus Omnitrophota bacterium]